jgi:glycosyltransferase involved in cell wall biosynthesis
MAFRRLLRGPMFSPRNLVAGGTAEPAGLAPPRAGDAEISVVIPLYNHERYISAALHSVLAQTAPPIEVVVIDDGSRDDGFGHAQRLLAGSAGCQVVRQDNAGAHAAINRAVGLCRGSYIAVLNSDDMFLPDKLAYCQDAIAAESSTDLIAGGVVLIDESGQRLRGGVATDWLARARAFAERCLSDRLALLNENDVATTSNMVFSRRLWERVGGFAPLRYCHDLDFLLQAFDHGRVVLDRGREHVMYRVHGQNTIGEDGHRIRVEIAAVIAASLRDSGSRVLPNDGDGLDAFNEFLRNKDLSDLVLYLATLRDRFATRAAFFEHVTGDPLRERLVRQLRARAA